MLTLEGLVRKKLKMNVFLCFFVGGVLLFHQALLMAFDEDMFYEYAVYSTIYMYDVEESGQMELQPYLDDMKSRFPEFMSDEWKSYGEDIAQDPAKQSRFCIEVVKRLMEKGYKSEILEVGAGLYTVQIVD